MFNSENAWGQMPVSAYWRISNAQKLPGRPYCFTKKHKGNLLSARAIHFICMTRSMHCQTLMLFCTQWIKCYTTCFTTSHIFFASDIGGALAQPGQNLCWLNPFLLWPDAL